MKHTLAMNKYFFAIIALLFFAACGQKDPNQELNDLKAQRTEIDARITELEKQLGINSDQERSKKNSNN